MKKEATLRGVSASGKLKKVRAMGGKLYDDLSLSNSVVIPERQSKSSLMLILGL